MAESDSRFCEARIDRAIHLAALAAAAVGATILIPTSALRLEPPGFLGILLYVVGLFAMLTCSTLYNGCGCPDRKDFFCKLDRSGIFLMIAGSYSAFFAKDIADPQIATLLAVVWILALAGVALAVLAPPASLKRLAVVLYVAMGWSMLVALGPIWTHLPTGVLSLVIAGGAIYTTGVIFYLLERLPYQTAIWHGFVVAAASCHFIAVLSNLPEA